MVNKWMYNGMLGLALSLVVAGCGTKQDASQEGNPDAAQDKSQVMDGLAPAEIVFYTTNGDDEAHFDRLYGNALRKKFPQFTIKYILGGSKGTSLTELLTTKTRIDVFMQAPGFFEGQAYPAKLEYDMSELVKKHKVDLGRLDPSSVAYTLESSGGKQYSLPIQLDGMVLYYNKDLFDKFGVTYPTDNMTWGEMIEKSKQLTRFENNTQYFGFSSNLSTNQGMNPFSIPLADLATDTPTINKDERWRSFYQLFYEQPKQASGYLNAIQTLKGLPTITNFVNNQNIAMFAYQAGLINVWEENLKAVNWDIVALPAIPGKSGVGSMPNPKLFGITSMAQDKDAAMQAIHYLLSDEHQKELARMGVIPVVNSDAVKVELGKNSFYKDKNWKAAVTHKFAPLAPRPAYYTQLNAIYQKHFLRAALETVDLNTALREAEEEAVKAIAAFKSQ